MNKILIIGNTSTVGLAIGRTLAATCDVFYAGRKNADYIVDLSATHVDFPSNITFDVIVHAAADFGGDTDEDFSRAEVVNAIGTLNVCKLANKVQAKHVLLISSLSASYVQGDADFNIYALSKRHGEELARLYCEKHNIPLTILRPTCLFDGAENCRLHQKLFYMIINKAAAGEDIVLYGKNDAVRNYLFMDDFVEIVNRVIQKNITGTYFCASLINVRISEIAQTAYRVFGQIGKIVFAEDKPDIADMPGCDVRHLYQKIEYAPRTTIEQGIRMIKKIRESK